MPECSVAYIAVRMCAAAAALLAALAAGIAAPGAPRPVSFNYEVRPLLSDRCFTCHGPDERARKARLRLDTADGMLGQGPGDRQPVVIPGRPDESALWQRLAAKDPEDRMPPPASKLTLSESEVEVIRRWIQEGAAYEPHWSLRPVEAGDPPPGAGAGDHPIDRFVRSRLIERGMPPAPPATAEQLLRRLSLDLTGLPPTLEELDAFLVDPSPEAYAREVDRLLASPAYGERRATEWLDLSRYADTYGYQSDVARDMSPWRDWVIRAFNENLPYDAFILWQLAGDLLPNPTPDQRLATAWNRLHRQTNEGGSIDEEFRTEYAADRVHTFGTAFLGLTLECARCHDHKYDPISQRDYYQLMAFFNNIDESGLYSHFTAATPTPAMALTTEAQAAHHAQLREAMAAHTAALACASPSERERFAAWLGSGPHILRPPSPVAQFSFDVITNAHSPEALGRYAPAQLVDDPATVPGYAGQALEFSGDNGATLKGLGAFGRTAPFSFALWLRPANHDRRAVVFHRSRAWTDSGSRGYELVLDVGRPAFGLIHFWPGNAVMVRAVEALPTNAWTHLTVTYDGSSRAAGVRLYANGEPLATETLRDQLTREIFHRAEWGDADADGIELTLASRFRDAGFRHGQLDELQIFDRCLTGLEVRQVAGRVTRDVLTQEALLEHYLRREDSEARATEEALFAVRQEENRLVHGFREIMVMAELPYRRPTHILRRGAYDAPGEAVEPGTPAALPPLKDGLPRNRLGLAHWLLDPQHPLTARVVVNRAWATHFGRGLVATPEDFGSQGRLPDHPQLLDWLAGWFVGQGWDLKGLHRLIATSATYRQSSQASPELLARDPENSLFARGPRRRLEAEQLRDSALAVSGLLWPEVGGPSVRPYQPAGLWEEAGTGKTYQQDQGHALYRRSLYTFWKRTAPPPNMLTFDATSREVCTARRSTTTTPLQALVLLNDPQFVEAARVLAQRLLRRYPSDPEARHEAAFRLATSRRPLPAESRVLRRLYEEQLAHFEAHPDAAGRYVQAGASPVDGSLPAGPLAATTVVVNTALNLDEFMILR